MLAAKKGAASFVAASPAENFGAVSRSEAQRSDLGLAGLSSLAFSGAAQYEIATKRRYADCFGMWGMGQVRASDHPELPSDEVRGEVPRMFESEIPLPDPLRVARVRYSDLRSGARR
jgi:hypothetical protein